MTLKSVRTTISFFLIFISLFLTLSVYAKPSFLLHSDEHFPQNLKKKLLSTTNFLENPIKLKDVFMTQKNISSDHADMEAQIVVVQSQPNMLYFKVHYGIEVTVLDTFLTAGEHRFSLPFVIQKPRLSRTNISGTPFLYTFRTFVTNGKGQSDEMQSRIGLRPMESVKKQIYTEGVLADKKDQYSDKNGQYYPDSIIRQCEKVQ